MGHQISVSGGKTRSMRRRGVTLIELLVVFATISLLVAMLMPAVQSAREAARRISCKNNLKQMGLAVHNYQSTYSVFPPSFTLKRGTIQRGSWSIQARILPHLDQGVGFGRVQLGVDWHSQLNSGIPTLKVPTFLCPSDPNPFYRTRNGQAYVRPQTYGFNYGTWFIFDPVTGETGDGSFGVNSGHSPADFTDGMSTTLCAAEVKAYTPYIRNTSDPGRTIPTSPSRFTGMNAEHKLGPNPNQNTGHTVWCDGRVHHSGFTTTFVPNTIVSYSFRGQNYDIDFNSRQEGRSLDQPTYAAVTSRGYHTGIVNVVLMDGSARSINDSIETSIWRGLGTRGSGEIVAGQF